MFGGDYHRVRSALQGNKLNGNVTIGGKLFTVSGFQWLLLVIAFVLTGLYVFFAVLCSKVEE